MTGSRSDACTMRLAKYHGLGNDFLITFAPAVPGGAADLARRLCHRRHGVGADGLIIATPLATVEAPRTGTPPPAGGAGTGEVAMWLWNSDGSVAEVSGNGLRCLTHALARRHKASHFDTVIHTVAGPRHCRVNPSTAVSPGTVQVTAEMGYVHVGAALRPERGLPDLGDVIRHTCGIKVERWTTVQAGNPHVVVMVPDPSEVPLTTAGPAVEAHFPAGVNVHFAALRPNDASNKPRIILRVWERGAGVTQACGSGAVATAAAFGSWGWPGEEGEEGEEVVVQMPGGEAVVQLAPVPALVGPSTHVADIAVMVGSPDRTEGGGHAGSA